MLQSIKQLYGSKLRALDGDLGEVKDFYFSDQNWAVRYVVAETGTWLTDRQVLLSPHAFGVLHQDGKALVVNLARKQIADSPSIELHKPVSQQYEEEYHRYYGWPYYWEGDGLWGGMRNVPVMEPPAKLLPAGKTSAPALACQRGDSHLRSTQSVNGYHLQASEGIIGHICDFMIDRNSWAIDRLVVKIGHRFTGNEVQIPVSKVDRISYDESTVFVNLTKAAVEQNPAQLSEPIGATA